MKFPLTVLATLALVTPDDRPWIDRLASWASADLRSVDQQLGKLDKQLSALPEMMLINSSLRVGFKSGYTTDENVRWVEVTLREPALVDSIVLVPPLAKAATAVVTGYGFPVRFMIEGFDAADEARLLLDQTREDFPNPNCFPVTARFAPRMIKRVRLTATDPWAKDGPDVLAIAEMLILFGNRNVALDGKVTSSSSRNAPRAWTRANLVDMITPIGLPVAPQSGGTRGYHSAVTTSPDEAKSITLTLPKAVSLDEVRLVPVRRKEVPLWFDYGFPSLYKVESATLPDFSDAILLSEVTDPLAPSPGMNVVAIAAQGVQARYVRFTATQLWQNKDDRLLALAELQAYSGGHNIAPQGTLTATDVLQDDPQWSLASLTDGLTENGRLLELPDWIAQLEHRQTLERERAHLRVQRTDLIERFQQTLVYGSAASVGGITLLSGLVLWRQQRSRRRDAQRLQDKLARDLHDEIGSNLGSITLICSMASQSDATLDSLKADMADIERVAAESAESMRDMVQLISPRAPENNKDWLRVLHSLTERLLRSHELDCQLPTSPLIYEPDPATRRELYLFCKEVLHNIARHAQATQVSFHIAPVDAGLSIRITDNGIGFDTAQSSSGHGLGNLRQRASSLKADLNLRSGPGAGTTIQLTLPRTHRWRASGT